MDLERPCSRCGKLVGPKTFTEALEAELRFRSQIPLGPGQEWRAVSRAIVCDPCFLEIERQGLPPEMRWFLEGDQDEGWTPHSA